MDTHELTRRLREAKTDSQLFALWPYAKAAMESVSERPEEEEQWSPEAAAKLWSLGLLRIDEWLALESLKQQTGGLESATEVDRLSAYLSVNPEEVSDLGYRVFMYSATHDLPHRCLTRDGRTLHYYLTGPIGTVYRYNWTPATADMVEAQWELDQLGLRSGTLEELGRNE